MITQVKRTLGHVMFGTGLDAVLLRNAAVIVAFHRVFDGGADDTLSVSPEMFERHCRFFKRHFRVVPLAELITKLERGERLNRHLAITFDDGYQDNFVHARPILESLSLPATFFVVSHWVGTDEWAWWDRDRGVRHQWMTWNQVRCLNERGFDIGAHKIGRAHV